MKFTLSKAIVMVTSTLLLFGCGPKQVEDVSVTLVTLDQTSATLSVGNTLTLEASINPTNATNKNVTWSTDKTDIVSVSNEGVVSALKVGRATVTVTSVSNPDKKASCEITVGHYQGIKEELAKGVTEEKTWATYYDKDDNRFNITLHYDLHFGLALHIVEYDLWDFLANANEGEVSEDSESITFTNSALEKTALFKRGTYVLSHTSNGGFTLDAAGVLLNLTTEAKEDPNYIDKDLVGTYEYRKGVAKTFELSVQVGEKENHYPTTITLNEGSKTFTGSNLKNNEATSTFDISGSSDGQYIKNTVGAELAYNENNETYKLKIGDTTYNLTKTSGYIEPEKEKGYFELNVDKIKLSCSDFEVTMTDMGGTGYILFYIHELVEGGKNINCVFEVVDEDTVTNFQTITNPNNKIFVGHDKYTFVHSVVNDVDKVDLYFDGVLAYENLTITPIEAE